MIPEPLHSDCLSVATDIAPEIDQPLYLVDTADVADLPVAKLAVNGCVVVERYFDVRLRERLGARYAGPGPVIFINTTNIAKDIRPELFDCAVRTFFVHELTHYLPFRRVEEIDDTPRVRQLQAERMEMSCDPVLCSAVEVYPWSQHDADFTRFALHLFHRADRLGFDMSLKELCGGYLMYALSGPSVYQAELGDEPERMLGAKFDEIAAAEPPAGFTELFARDCEFYFQKHPKETTE